MASETHGHGDEAHSNEDADEHSIEEGGAVDVQNADAAEGDADEI